MSILSLLMSVVMVALGALTVYLLELMAKHTEKKQAERLISSSHSH